MKRILHVGLDVDDKAFHGAAFCRENGETTEFKSRPTFGALMQKLQQLQVKGFDLKVCYEATYIGYSLCRELRGKAIDCEIVAPSLIPQKPSDRVKTDRLDGRKLAEYYAKDLLTTIYVPNEEDEQTRDLIRARNFLVKQRKRMKMHILATCRRYGLNYKEATNHKYFWTTKHLNWLAITINKLPDTLKKLLDVLVSQMVKLNDFIEEYNAMIEELSEQEKYKTKRDALNCFRGLDTLSSMTLIAEIGDIHRFRHPKQLTSYCGLDVCEYSSGGKERKYGITKMGNKWIRTIAIEACQRVADPPFLSRRLREVRKEQDRKIIDISERCTKRLKKKSNSMFSAGKHTNKVKVACAREFLGFVWEALNHVA